MIRICFLLTVAIGLFGIFTTAQTHSRDSQVEQSRFAVEGITIRKPIEVPSAVLKILRREKYVLDCLQEGETSNAIPARWFVGSEIHLNGPNETDLIVVPRELAIDQSAGSENACLYGANVAPFWVFQKVAGGYNLVLDISVVRLEILDTKSNGLRDIRTSSFTAVTETTLIFRFDGRRYRLSKRTSKAL